MDTNAFTFSPQQLQAIDAVQNWLAAGTARKPYFRLFGHAGTGKTTFARHLAAGANFNVVDRKPSWRKTIALHARRFGVGATGGCLAFVFRSSVWPKGQLCPSRVYAHSASF